MPTLSRTLVLPRCPHCAVANPNLYTQAKIETANFSGGIKRTWFGYVCARCGGVVIAAAQGDGAEVDEYYPSAASVDPNMPDRPREYLQQALESVHAPAGAVMLAASAVDSMLKLKGYRDGTLYARIEQAAADHLITTDMAEWAHEVRLDANDQRHADEEAEMPTTDDAKRVIDFAQALAEIMFVLPGRVAKGREDAQGGG